MSLKKFSVVLVALLALGAIVASSASATVKTTRAEWYTGASPGTTLPVGTEETIELELVEHTDGLKHSVFTSGIGAGGSTPLELTATGLSCVSCKISNKENLTSLVPAAAYGKGQVNFTGVTVSKPAGCTVSSELGVANTVLTKSLEIHGDFMDTNETNKKAFIQFRPVGTTTFAQFRLENCGALNGKYNVGGSLFVESKNDTGVFGTTQDAESSKTINETAGAGLELGIIPATLTGTVRAKLASGKSFAIKP